MLPVCTDCNQPIPELAWFLKRIGVKRHRNHLHARNVKQHGGGCGSQYKRDVGVRTRGADQTRVVSVTTTCFRNQGHIGKHRNGTVEWR